MELDFETLQQVVAMLPELAERLPPEYVAKLELALEVIGATSLVLAALKPAIAKWVTSPEVRHWCDAVIKVFDLVASNTKGMDLRPLAEKKEKKK